MLVVEGGDEVQDLFKYLGKVLPRDTYRQAVDKVKKTLKSRGNRISAVFKLFNNHSQSSQSVGTRRSGRRHSSSTIRTTTPTRPDG